MGVAPVNEEVWTAVIVAGIILEENRIPGLVTVFFINAKKIRVSEINNNCFVT
jgi:hypothetical protein